MGRVLKNDSYSDETYFVTTSESLMSTLYLLVRESTQNVRSTTSICCLLSIRTMTGYHPWRLVVPLDNPPYRVTFDLFPTHFNVNLTLVFFSSVDCHSSFRKVPYPFPLTKRPYLTSFSCSQHLISLILFRRQQERRCHWSCCLPIWWCVSQIYLNKRPKY